ncbi:hypothetical protein H0H92_006397 [Tricholoma furcatifolium]|nr:hypothetical protein H0H92_006397 [Tricholoma furcatifolium]
MSSPPPREGAPSPDLPAMAFVRPENLAPGERYDEETALKISNLIDEELKTLDQERPSWRPVVYFNVLKAVRMTLDELDYELSSRSKEAEDSDPDAIVEIPVASSSTQPLPTHHVSSSNAAIEAIQREIGELRAKLLPLVALEDTLASELSGGVSVTGGRTGAYVRSGWQALVTSAWPLSDSRTNLAKNHSSEFTQLTAKTLAATIDSIKALWGHRAVKRLVEAKKLRLEESAPFFLDNIDRIAQPDFVPDNDDILNVRLQTLGIMEHTFPINMGGVTYDWKLYDVGGARGQRHAWVPYFDDGKTRLALAALKTLVHLPSSFLVATAIIFLAPISAFDQYLEEDPKTNRIDDSLQLFNAICSNKLLVKAHLVLLLNKAGAIRYRSHRERGSPQKEAGFWDQSPKIVSKHALVLMHGSLDLLGFIPSITSYGERPNVYENVSEYFRSHFMQVHRRKDIAKRSLFVDIKATQGIIANVGEVILRRHIEQIGLA